MADYTQAFLNVEVQEEKQLDFLESMQVYEKVYVDILTSGTRVMTMVKMSAIPVCLRTLSGVRHQIGEKLGTEYGIKVSGLLC